MYRDSILQEENLKNVSEIETKYETAKKDKELLAQNLEIEQANGRLQSRNAQLYFLLFSLVLLGYVFWQRQKRKNQEIDSLKKEHQIKTLESLIQGEEKERFRIARELHDGVNALKHAEAQQINVQLSCREEEIQLTVEDDGKGFDTSAQNKSGIGLSNIQSRVDYLQADKDVLSNQEGTSYTLSMNKNILP